MSQVLCADFVAGGIDVYTLLAEQIALSFNYVEGNHRQVRSRVSSTNNYYCY